MMKKIKENQYVKWILEILKIPRAKALVKLVLWLIFFVIVFIVFDINGNRNTTKTTDMWTMNDYIYQATITINQDTYSFTGETHGEEELFTFENETYFLKQDVLYVVTDTENLPNDSSIILHYDVTKLKPLFFKELISNATLESTTNYKSGMVQKSYSLKTAKFVELYQQSEITDDSMIKIEVSEQDGILKEIHLDLTEFQKYNQETIENYQINILYSKKEVE